MQLDYLYLWEAFSALIEEFSYFAQQQPLLSLDLLKPFTNPLLNFVFLLRELLFTP